MGNSSFLTGYMAYLVNTFVLIVNTFVLTSQAFGNRVMEKYFDEAWLLYSLDLMRANSYL